MAAAAVAEFQRAQSLLGTDRNASIDILHSIGKYIATNEFTKDQLIYLFYIFCCSSQLAQTWLAN